MTTGLSYSQTDFRLPPGTNLPHVVAEYNLQLAVMAGQQSKNAFAMQQLVSMNQQGLITGREAIAFLIALDETIDFPEYYADIWRKFSADILAEFLSDVQALIRISAKNIAEEVYRSLYVLPPPRRGLMYRLIFGEE